MTPTEAILAVIEYNYDKEAEDYSANPSENHIFNALRLLREEVQNTQGQGSIIGLKAGLNDMVESHRLREDQIPDDWDWLMAELSESDEATPREKHPYTVILLYPDSVSNKAVETYSVDIQEASSPRDAVEQAQHQCLADNDWKSIEDDEDEGYDPADFVPLYVFNGIAPRSVFSHFGGSYGIDDVPAFACAYCGMGFHREPSARACSCRKREACRDADSA